MPGTLMLRTRGGANLRRDAGQAGKPGFSRVASPPMSTAPAPADQPPPAPLTCRIDVESVRRLAFDDGSPVRAASALARLGDGWLVAQDDANFAAWQVADSITALRIFPPVQGVDHFSETDGTKHLKADLEAACSLRIDGGPAVLLLGSGSSPMRKRAALVRLGPLGADVSTVALDGLYEQAAATMGVAIGELNIEGACLVDDHLRLFNRGNLRAGSPNCSVDVALAGLLARFDAAGTDAPLELGPVRRYDLGGIDGVGLSVTDALTLPDGRILISAAAEDTPNNIDDGPVVGAALAVLEEERVVRMGLVPQVEGAMVKLEGIALLDAFDDGLRVLGVVDNDDPAGPSLQLVFRVEASPHRWPSPAPKRNRW